MYSEVLNNHIGKFIDLLEFLPLVHSFTASKVIAFINLNFSIQ